MNALAVGAALLTAIANAVAGTAARSAHPISVLLVSAPVALLIAVGSASVVGGDLTPAGALWAAVAGISGGIVLPLAYRAFAIGPVGAVSASIAASSTLVATGAGLVLGEVLSAVQGAALLLCVVSILLVTLGRGGGRAGGRGTVLGAFVGIGFGGFTVAAGLIPPDSGLWPLAVTRAVVLVIVLVVAGLVLLRGSRRGDALASAWRPVAVAGAIVGLTDVAANTLLFAATQVSDLSVVALGLALGPAFAAAIGRVFLRQRLR